MCTSERQKLKVSTFHLFPHAGIKFHKPIDKERLLKEIKRRKKLNDRKLDNN